MINPNGIKDDWHDIMAEIYMRHSSGGGVVVIPDGCRVSRPIIRLPGVGLEGAGKDKTVIKPLDDAIIGPSHGVIETEGFADVCGQSVSANYYPPYTHGVHYGGSINGITIDGNRANVEGNGICWFGGQWNFDDLGVINTDGYGIWTEGGVLGDTISGDDWHDFLNMYESTARNVMICNTNKHGWSYRGPNDSFIDNIQIKCAEWGGFVQEPGYDSFGLKIGSLHAYACKCLHTNQAMIELFSAQADKIYVDSSHRHGMIVSGKCLINQIKAYKNNYAGYGDFWSTKITGEGAIIGIFSDQTAPLTTGNGGGSLHVDGTYSRVGNLDIAKAAGATVNQTGLKLTGGKMDIKGTVRGFATSGDVGASLSNHSNHIDLRLVSCHTGLNYVNTGIGQNNMRLSFNGCTTDIAKEVDYAGTDQLLFISSQSPWRLSVGI